MCYSSRKNIAAAMGYCFLEYLQVIDEARRGE
jgi:hypothetical protein